MSSYFCFVFSAFLSCIALAFLGWALEFFKLGLSRF